MSWHIDEGWEVNSMWSELNTMIRNWINRIEKEREFHNSPTKTASEGDTFL
jgi:hypothetical protein